MKNVILFLILLFNTSCGPSMSNLSYEEKISYRMMQEFGKEMASDGYCLTSLGLKGPNQKIELLNIGFNIDEVLSFTSSRQHVVKLIQKFVLKINSRKDLAKYLIVSPITPESIAVSISGLTPCVKNDNFVKFVSGREGCISYFDGTLEYPRFGFLKEESFEEALNIMAESNVSNN